MIVLHDCFEVDVICRVYGFAVDDGFEVDVWAGYVTGCAHGCDGLTLLYGVTYGYVICRKVRIAGHEAAWMLDINAVAIGREPGCADNGAALCCIDWGAYRACNVYAKVEVTNDASNRVDAIAVEGADVGYAGRPEEGISD